MYESNLFVFGETHVATISIEHKLPVSFEMNYWLFISLESLNSFKEHGYVNPFQPSVVFHIHTGHLICCQSNYCFLYEMKYWAEMG